VATQVPGTAPFAASNPNRLLSERKMRVATRAGGAEWFLRYTSWFVTSTTGLCGTSILLDTSVSNLFRIYLQALET
jgi:hypothetical protein